VVMVVVAVVPVVMVAGRGDSGVVVGGVGQSCKELVHLLAVGVVSVVLCPVVMMVVAMMPVVMVAR